MKNKKDTTWHAIKQGFLIIFILVAVVLSLGFILLAALYLGLEDKEEEKNEWDDNGILY